MHLNKTLAGCAWKTPSRRAANRADIQTMFPDLETLRCDLRILQPHCRRSPGAFFERSGRNLTSISAAVTVGTRPCYRPRTAHCAHYPLDCTYFVELLSLHLSSAATFHARTTAVTHITAVHLLSVVSQCAARLLRRCYECHPLVGPPLGA